MAVDAPAYYNFQQSLRNICWIYILYSGKTDWFIALVNSQFGVGGILVIYNEIFIKKNFSFECLYYFDDCGFYKYLSMPYLRDHELGHQCL